MDLVFLSLFKALLFANEIDRSAGATVGKQGSSPIESLFDVDVVGFRHHPRDQADGFFSGEEEEV